jgi:hypothetical protein
LPTLTLKSKQRANSLALAGNPDPAMTFVRICELDRAAGEVPSRLPK